MNREDLRHEAGAHRDPITDAPGAHPVGTGIGAALGGAASGAVAGAVAGPVGALVGAAAGAVVGGLAGKAMAESVDPTYEHDYWRDHFFAQPYVPLGATYVDYGPAYLYGIEAYTRFHDMEFDTIEVALEGGWYAARGNSRLEWAAARQASRDAWNRLHTRTQIRH